MTAQQYADSRPDLVNNWAAAQVQNGNNDSGWEDESEIAQYIRQFQSFADYLANDYGNAFDAPSAPAQVAPRVGAMPPIAVSSAAAQNYLNLRQDLAQNWRNAWSDAFAADPVAMWIRGFGSFQAYLENDHGGPFMAVVVSPPYVPPGAGSGNPPPAQVSPFFDPTHRLIGQTAAGPVYFLIDEGGSIKIWIESANGITGLRDGGKATKSAALTAVELANSLSGQTGPIIPPIVPGAPGPGTPGAVNLPPGGISPLFDPVHRLVGYTREGYEVYRQTDEGGHLVEYYDIPGQGATGEHYLTGANDPATYVYTTSRPATPPGISSTPGAGTGGSSLLWLGAAAGLAFWLGRKRA